MTEQRVWRKSSYSGANNNCVEVSLPHWHKSSHSGVNENCPEVANLPGTTALRDSKHPDAAVLTFPSTEWEAFLHAVQNRRL